VLSLFLLGFRGRSAFLWRGSAWRAINAVGYVFLRLSQDRVVCVEYRPELVDLGASATLNFLVGQ
jgi:hypothetical protein